MKERPILFSAPMVRAILEDRKTQTRRVMKRQPYLSSSNPPNFSDTKPGDLFICPDRFPTTDNPGKVIVECDKVGVYHCMGQKEFAEKHSPYGQPGDLIWVKEPWRIGEDVGEGWYPGAFTGDLHLIYDSDGYRDYRSFPADYRWPRNAKETHNSEGTDEHWISYGPIPSIFMPRWASRLLLEVVSVRVERLQDISEEDVLAEGAAHSGECDHARRSCEEIGCYGPNSYRGGFADLWQSINGPGSWDKNPWVWVVEFKRIGSAA